MTSYRTKEEVEREFCGKFPQEIYQLRRNELHDEYNNRDFEEMAAKDFKHFIHSLRLSDLESIIEDVDGLFEDEMIVKSDGHPFRMKKVKCDENVALDSAKKSVLSYLKSLKQ